MGVRVGRQLKETHVTTGPTLSVKILPLTKVHRIYMRFKKKKKWLNPTAIFGHVISLTWLFQFLNMHRHKRNSGFEPHDMQNFHPVYCQRVTQIAIIARFFWCARDKDNT